jgi:KAP family P-loop domain.
LEETNSDRYFVFHYNCWQHDYYEEPAVAIISAMLASIKEDEALISEDVDNAVRAGYEYAKDKIKEIAGLYIENKIGVNLISLADEIKNSKEETESAEWEFDKMFSFSQTIEKVRKKLQEIAVERTLVLFVDELDRCIPQYAIKVLERLHHIFYGLDNVIVIMAIDRKQLEHSVEEMFGVRKDESSIDIEKYLKKFIDFSMVLDNGVVNESFKEKYDFYLEKFIIDKESGIDSELHEIFVDFMGEGIRQQEKIIHKASMVHSLISNEKLDISVLVFEILYEIFRVWGIENPSEVLKITNFQTFHFDKIIGEKKKMTLGKWEEKAIIKAPPSQRKYLKLNLYGTVLWYFDVIFYEKETLYQLVNTYNGSLDKELEVVKKYCEFCEIVK